MEAIDFAIFPSSLGNILLVARDGKIAELSVARVGEEFLAKRIRQRHPGAKRNELPFTHVRTKLDRYLRRQPVEFDEAIDLTGLTPFTRRVLEEVRKIPFGQTRSYGWIAEKTGCPGGGRAVGRALATNPVPIIVPCHRVIRGDGTLGGFSMDGVSKSYLLGLEGIVKAER